MFELDEYQELAEEIQTELIGQALARVVLDKPYALMGPHYYSRFGDLQQFGYSMMFYCTLAGLQIGGFEAAKIVTGKIASRMERT